MWDLQFTASSGTNAPERAAAPTAAPAVPCRENAILRAQKTEIRMQKKATVRYGAHIEVLSHSISDISSEVLWLFYLQ